MVPYNVIDCIKSFVQKISDKLSFNSWSNYFKEFQNQYYEYQSLVDEYWNQYKQKVIDFAAANGLTDLLKPAMEPLWNMDARKNVQKFIKLIREQISGERMVNDYWKYYSPRMTVNEPKKGRFEMEIPLPVQAKSLEDLVDHLHPERLNAIKQSVQEQLSNLRDSGIQSLSENDMEFGNSIYNSINRYSPSSANFMNMVPPFESTAFLVGNQHVVTFDGHVYDFKAGCEYLLARDFHNGRFTIKASFGNNYNQIVLQSIITEFANHEITMHRNGKIEVDGRSEQLPWQELDSLHGSPIVQVYRLEHTTTLKTYDGITVACDSYYQVCKVSLPGRYHSHSAGVLGSNDNEPSNDLYLIDGSESEDLNNIADHWSIKGKCLVNEAYKNTQDYENEDCRRAFKSAASSLRPCFGQVMPDAYYQMCLSDMSMDNRPYQSEQFQGICNVTAAYLMACEKVGIQLEPLEQCMRCKSPKSEYEQLTQSRVVKSEDLSEQKESDVVFVVEEKNCLINNVNTIVQMVNQFNRKQNDMRFGWIGFGGIGVHYDPHMHTADDSLSVNSNGIREIVKQVKEATSVQTEMIDLEPNDPMKAIVFALKHFPFRPAVQKTIVLATCQLCDYQEIDHSTLQEALLNQGVVLHVLTTKPIEISGDQEAVGFDAEDLFDESGRPTGLRSELQRPNDVCSVLAQETFGTVFKMTANKVAISRIFQRTALQQKKNTCQICQCEANVVAPRTVCTPCNVVEPATLKAKSFMGFANFFQRQNLLL